jgi:CIC family chloride channel protein
MSSAPPGRQPRARSADELRGYFEAFLLAALIGVLGGLGAIGFQRLADLARSLWSGRDGKSLLEAARALPWWQALLIPAAGGLVATVLVRLVFRRRGSSGMADILETVSLRKGGIRLGDVLARSLGTCAVIGSGGSIGREGPILQIGSAMATSLGRFARLPPRDLAVTIACRAAAGMAGAYNAPIGAAMFVMEVVLGSFVMEQFAPVIVASVTSVLTVRAIVGSAPVYTVPPFSTASPWEAVPIFVLGLLSALAGWGFLRCLSACEDALHGSRLPAATLPVLGGLVVGAIGIALPEVWGNGYDAVDLMLKGALPLALVSILVPAKALATGVTAGSGVGGGVFTPTLFVGAALGGTFGTALLAIWPHSGIEPGLFALIGMGSVLAATTHAPLMSILILFEMTSDSALIAPLMLGAVTATLFARWIHADSIYTARLRKRGIRLPEGVEEAALLRTYARDLLRSDAEVLPANAPIAKVIDRFLNTRRDALYVVGDGGRYVGVARIHDVKAVFDAAPEGGTVIAMDVAVPARSVSEDEAIGSVLARFDDPELDEVPVVASVEDPRFVGTLARRDILAMLRHEVLVEPSRPVRVSRKGGGGSAYLELPEGWTLREVPAPPEEWGKKATPGRWQIERQALPLVVLRGDGTGSRRPLAPSETELREGDTLVVLGPATPGPNP